MGRRPAEAAGGAAPRPAYAVEEIHRDRAPLIEAVMGSEADVVRSRFARGCRCFVAFADGSVAGYGWLSTGPEWIGELELEIRPRKAEGYIWNCVTLAAHRRQGVFRSVVAGIMGAARTSGIKLVWLGSLAIPAERTLPALGFERAAGFRSSSFAGVHLLRVAPEPTPLGRQVLHVVPVHRGFYIAPVTHRRH